MKYITSRWVRDKEEPTMKEWSTVEKAIAYAKRYAKTSKHVSTFVMAEGYATFIYAIYSVPNGELTEINNMAAFNEWKAQQEEKIAEEENSSLPAEPEIEAYEATAEMDDVEFKENVVYVSDKPGQLIFDVEVATTDDRKAFDYIWNAIGKYLATHRHDYAEGIYKDWCPDEEFSDIETYPEIMDAQNSYKDADDFYADYGLKVDMQINDSTIYICINVSNGDEYAKAKAEVVKADRVAESGAAVATGTSMMEIRETMDVLGTSFLSDAELFGYITKTNPDKFHNDDIGTIIRNPLTYEGVGKAKATMVEAVKELLKRLVQTDTDKVIVHGPDDVARVLMPEYRYKQKEYFLAVLMNTKNHIIKVAEVSMGSLSASIVHPREVFYEAIKYHAACMIIAHNHPSGDPSPSREDVQVTDRLVKSGKILNIPVLDHIIIGDGTYLSFKERGMMD